MTLGAALACAAWLTAAPARAATQESRALELGKQAMQSDYLAMRFKQAEQKLKQALQVCGKKHCLAVVRARLHADLAIVYLVGSKKRDKGKQEMKAALDADAAVQLNPDFSTPEADKIFEEAGGVKQVADEDTGEDEQEAAEDEAERRARAAEAVPRNWVTVAFQQEVLLYEATSGVCSTAEQYQCYAGRTSYNGPVYPGAANKLDMGLGLGTRRVLVGYQRLLLGRITVGGRIGFAFSGRPNKTIGVGEGFNPLHAEVRGSFWFGQRPFERKGQRFFAGLAAGIGEVNGRASVPLYSDQASYQVGAYRTLDAWRKTGPYFAGVQGGVAYAFVPSHQLELELRLLRMFGSAAFVGAVGAGYTFGF